MEETQSTKSISTGSANLLRDLPSVDSLIKHSAVQNLEQEYGRELTIESLRYTLSKSRSAILAGSQDVPSDDELVTNAGLWIKHLTSPSLIPVVNATGVIVHTNLGRAPLSSQAQRAVQIISGVYSNLEYDLGAGSRGSRTVHTEKLLSKLTTAESALVVNNNAAAVLLSLSALCRDSEVIISRGQLIEIGGGFRIPDVMAQSGAKLIEVGTTNRTHLSDYERAINSNTAAILVAHHSNFKVVGFTSEPTLTELAVLARDKDILLLYDQGSGALLGTAPFGLDDEPTVNDALDCGVHLVMFSGDKMLGGPQAGIIVGQKSLVNKVKIHPLARAVRVDKMCLAALSMTLDSYIRNRAVEEIPVWQMIARSHHEIEKTANKWAKIFHDQGLQVKVLEGHSTIGGGSLPGAMLKTHLVAISGLNIQRLADDLRKATPPIVARISENQYLLDPRTVLSSQGSSLVANIISCAKSQL